MTQLEHIQRHLCERPRVHGKPWMLGPELADLVPWLVMPVTVDEIAAELGPGWTRRLVEYRFEMICDELGIPPSPRYHLERIALTRLVAGLDPCFCEMEKAA